MSNCSHNSESDVHSDELIMIEEEKNETTSSKQPTPASKPATPKADECHREIHCKGIFSVDEYGSFYNDNRSLKALNLPKNIFAVSIDLTKGLSDIKSLPSNDLHFIFQWILSNKSPEGAALMEYVPATILCSRATLIQMFIAPYCDRTWTGKASKFKNTIYIASSAMAECWNGPSSKNNFITNVFQQAMTKPATAATAAAAAKESISPNTEMHGVFSWKMGDEIIMYNGILDAIKPTSNSPLKTVDFVAIKSDPIITTEIEDLEFCKQQAMRYWAECFLSNIMNIYLGFRNEEHVVEYIRSYQRHSLADFGDGLWSPRECLDCVRSFLTFVKTTVVKDDPTVVYEFNVDTDHKVTWNERSTQSSPENQLLPDWYISHFVP